MFQKIHASGATTSGALVCEERKLIHAEDVRVYNVRNTDVHIQPFFIADHNEKGQGNGQR
jgi:hypothetical protein